MKKLLYLLVVLALLLAFVPAVAVAHTEAEPFVTELIADGGTCYGGPDDGSEEDCASPGTWGTDVGEVQVWNDGENLYVKYLVDSDLTPGDTTDDGVPTLIYQTHLHVATAPANIPQTKKGNPQVGLFDYVTMHDPGVDEHTYLIPLAWAPETDLTIAAHAVVKKLGGLFGLELALPDSVTMSVTYPYSGGPAYFPHTYVSGGTPLDGDYLGWCVDIGRVIYQNTNYTANVYSSYETLPAGSVDKPENMDLVNWIINQDYIGQPSPGCSGNYTYADVQYAIWKLIDNQISTSGLYGLSACRAGEIEAAALANGVGFVPGCGDVVAVVLAPVNVVQVIIAQVTFIEVGVPCDDIDETAWGEGSAFPGKQWATYFTYTVQ